jgi:hypothetical protein
VTRSNARHRGALTLRNSVIVRFVWFDLGLASDRHGWKSRRIAEEEAN